MRGRAMQGVGGRETRESGLGRKKREEEGGSCKHPVDQLGLTVRDPDSQRVLTELATRQYVASSNRVRGEMSSVKG